MQPYARVYQWRIDEPMETDSNTFEGCEQQLMNLIMVFTPYETRKPRNDSKAEHDVTTKEMFDDFKKILSVQLKYRGRLVVFLIPFLYAYFSDELQNLERMVDGPSELFYRCMARCLHFRSNKVKVASLQSYRVYL